MGLAAGSARLELVAAVAWSVAIQVSMTMGFHLTMEVQMDAFFAGSIGVEMLAVLWRPGGHAEPRERRNELG
jgi:hypothetical protein